MINELIRAAASADASSGSGVCGAKSPAPDDSVTGNVVEGVERTSNNLFSSTGAALHHILNDHVWNGRPLNFI